MEDVEKFVLILAPFAPFIAEELYGFCREVSNEDQYQGVHVQAWPKHDEELAREDNITFAIQVNGKVRSQVEVSVDLANNKDKVLKLAKENEEIKRWLDGEIVKEIFIPGKIVSFVVR
jgi:leucyl-tRNA synthetase